MAVKKKRAHAAPSEERPPIKHELRAALTWLERHGTKQTRDGMARYGITAAKAFGVTMADMRVLGKQLGRHHELALALWDTDWYEARMMVSFVGEPERLSPAQMDRFCRGFDSWALCDTLCFHLFDRSPHAFDKVVQWSKQRGEFQKRAAFALLASLALHDKSARDARFLLCLPLIERAAADERNFVKKAVSWALRGVGRRSIALNQKSIALAKKLAASEAAAPRWIGKDALRELSSAAVQKRLKASS